MVKQQKEEVDLSASLSEVWRVLTDKEREILRSNSTIQHFKRNELIYCEGDEPKDMMCLLKGKVKIYKDGVGGRSQIIRMIKPVQYFGYRASFAQEDYLTNASAFGLHDSYDSGYGPFNEQSEFGYVFHPTIIH